jgi:hypothetical protein
MASHTDFHSPLAIIALPSIASRRFSKCATRSAGKDRFSHHPRKIVLHQSSGKLLAAQ